MTLNIRYGTEEDKTSLFNINYQAWYRPEDGENIDFWKAVASLDINKYFAKTNYILITELENEIVGMMLGEIKDSNNDYFSHLMSSGRLEASIISKSSQELREYFHITIEEKDNFDKKADNLTYGKYDAAINIFAVNKNARDKGIGRKLFEHALKDFKQTNANSFYLYTDSYCDYEFYDYIGMERLAMYSNGKYDDYIYVGKIDKILKQEGK